MRPLKKLEDNGLSVLWVEGGWPGLTWPHVNARVGGQPAETTIVTPDARGWKIYGCSDTGGTLAMTTSIRSPYAVDNYYEMDACLRGPDTAANESAVRDMLASVRFHHSR
jgi:hypothetical protein